MHGASGWLLLQWGQADAVREIDQTPVPYAPDREWFTLAIKVKPTAPPKPTETPEEQGKAADPPAKTDQASVGAESKDEATDKQDESASPKSPPTEATPEAPPRAFVPENILLHVHCLFARGVNDWLGQ